MAHTLLLEDGNRSSDGSSVDQDEIRSRNLFGEGAVP